jgi:hypothetical protein
MQGPCRGRIQRAGKSTAQTGVTTYAIENPENIEAHVPNLLLGYAQPSGMRVATISRDFAASDGPNGGSDCGDS